MISKLKKFFYFFIFLLVTHSPYLISDDFYVYGNKITVNHAIPSLDFSSQYPELQELDVMVFNNDYGDYLTEAQNDLGISNNINVEKLSFLGVDPRIASALLWAEMPNVKDFTISAFRLGYLHQLQWLPLTFPNLTTLWLYNFFSQTQEIPEVLENIAAITGLQELKLGVSNKSSKKNSFTDEEKRIFSKMQNLKKLTFDLEIDWWGHNNHKYDLSGIDEIRALLPNTKIIVKKFYRSPGDEY